MDDKRMKRLSDEYTEYGGSAKSVSERLRMASADLEKKKAKDAKESESDETPAQKPGQEEQKPGDQEAAGKGAEVPADGSPFGAGKQGDDPEGEEAGVGQAIEGDGTGQEIVEPAEPTKLTPAELLQDPEVLLEEVDDDGDEGGQPMLGDAADALAIEEAAIGGENADKDADEPGNSDDNTVPSDGAVGEADADKRGNGDQDAANAEAKATPGQGSEEAGDDRKNVSDKDEDDDDEAVKRDMKAQP